ncbi:MAG TPA: hypothetical protein VHD32_11955 [Candidatus Didemnitutus sp.]|nr:hypothetical protein [Candidatus Didemnitutus sp.]
MEPEKLNSSASDDATFDRWLRAESRLDELPDHGFSRAVMQRLPSTRASRKDSRMSGRIVACLTALAFGCAVALISALRTPAAGYDWGTVNEEIQQAIAQIGTPDVGSAIGVTLLSLVYVFRSELRRWRMKIVGM